MSPDFADLLSAFNAQGVDYLIVGAHALAAHGLIRATRDFDVWVRPAPENAERVVHALREFGAPLLDLTIDDLSKPGLIFQIGVEPFRINVITAVDGVAFDEAWAEKWETVLDGMGTHVLSRRLLLANKRASGRPKDLLDVAWLEEHLDD